jgi:SAM-dependent methyltransferase
MILPIDLHSRYLIQAQWTWQLRTHLYRQLKFDNQANILEVGCGSGVITDELSKHFSGMVSGIDIDEKSIRFAHSYSKASYFSVADGCRLPFRANSFELTMCHYFLLWVSNPVLALLEMKRVTRPAGSIIALAEPDYGGRIDYPPDFEHIAELQEKSLSYQGADSRMGRQLAALFHKIGLENIETGILGGHWKKPLSPDEFESEWLMLKSDLAGYMSNAELEIVKEHDKKAWLNGERILYIPTFYAIGKKPR